jgi:hypothetical protein
VKVRNDFAPTPPFADLRGVEKFTDHKTAVVQLRTAVQYLGDTLEQKSPIAAAKQLAEKVAKLAKSVKALPRVAPTNECGIANTLCGPALCKSLLPQ